MSDTFATSAYQTVTHLAEQTAVHRAFQWFHLQEPKLRDWHRSVVSIAAPPFGEAARAHWLAERFRGLGLADVEVDACGNALGWIRAASRASLRAESEVAGSVRCTLLSAHLDTVFSGDDIRDPVQDGSRLLAPGASDNGAGVTALLAIASAMQSAGVRPATDILFVGNVGEEGEGNLRGMRYLFAESPAAGGIRSAVILDGAGTETIVTQGLGSRRFSITVTGPGGHSWTDAGISNPILVLANALAALGRVELPASPRTTWSIGHIEGGTAINAIPQRAQARLDTRSIDAERLADLEKAIRRAVAAAVCDANRPSGDTAGAAANRQPIRAEIEIIGERPAAALPDNAAVLTTLRAVDRHLGIQSHTRIASTDANIPLSLGIEAVSIGSGGSGGRVHTPEEWFDATGRDLALRRILLLVLALAQGG